MGKLDKIMGSANVALGGVTGLIQNATKAAQIKDTSEEQSYIDTLNNAQLDLNSYDAMQQLWDQTQFAETSYDMEDVRGMTNGQKAGSVLGAIGQGAATGAQLAGGWGAVGGAVVGLGTGLAGVLTGDAKARREASRLNTEGMIANNNFINKFENNTKNIAMNNKNEALLNIAAEGGYVPTRDFTNGMTFFSEGGSHEENPYQGIQQGVAPDGKPNLVEEGEWKYKDYIYSKRLKVPKKDYEMLGLKEGKDYTYADAAEAIQKESEERPNDPVSKRNLDVMMGRLQNSQETFKQKRDAMKMKREFEKLSPEEQAYMIQAMSQPQQAVPVQAQYAANGGHLFNDAGSLKFWNNTTADQWKTELPEIGEGQYVVQRTNDAGQTLYYLATGDPTKASGIYKDDAGNYIVGSAPVKNTSNKWAQALRATPAIGSGIGALVSMFDKPNYSNIKRAENMYRQIPMVSPKPIGNRMSYTPMDINYLMTQVGNQNIGNRRAIMESGAGNPGAVASALLASNYKGTTAMGEAFKQANEYNLKQRQLVDEFNRGTDMYNADADFKGQVQNQERARILADAFLRTGQLRDAELAQVQENKSASISNFLNNMGNLGTDMQNRDMVQALIDSGAYHTISDAMGKTGFKITNGNGGKLRKKGGKDA